MAEHYADDFATYIVMTRKEAVEVIAYLAAMLGNVAAPNSCVGAAPVLAVTRHDGGRKYRLGIVLKDEA